MGLSKFVRLTVFVLLAAEIATVGGCSQAKKAPTPSTHKMSGPDAGKLQREVFIGTDRRTQGNGKLPCVERGDALMFGHCMVNITAKHRPPSKKHAAATAPTVKQRPQSNQYDFSIDKVTLKFYDSSEFGEFSRLFQANRGEGSTKDVFLFIHGFNVQFDEAVITTAQMAFDLEFGGKAVCFDWPSLGKREIRPYLNDEESALWAVPHLVDFLKRLKQETGDGKIHVLTHSMGSRVLLAAMHELKLEGAGANGTWFEEVIFAAPDIDRDMFIARVLSGRSMAERITVYGSCADRALRLSESLHLRPRAGQGGKYIVVDPRFDSDVYIIDASWVDTSFIGHDSYRAPQATADMTQLIAGVADPSKRGLSCKSVKKSEGSAELTCWYFPGVKPSFWQFLFTSCD